MAVAERMYARALFEAARDENRVDAVHRELQAFSEALKESDELAAFLSNPQLDPRLKSEVLDRLSEGSEQLVRNFLKLTAEKGRAGQIRGIAEEFQGLVDAAQGRVKVELTTAYALSDDDAAAILAQIEQASGRTVEATRHVDPDLIGGMILQAGSLRVDASVRGRLERLRREIGRRG